jgi:hypothetical protein
VHVEMYVRYKLCLYNSSYTGVLVFIYVVFVISIRLRKKCNRLTTFLC